MTVLTQNKVSVVLCDVMLLENIYMGWNLYINSESNNTKDINQHVTTLNTLYIQNTQHYTNNTAFLYTKGQLVSEGFSSSIAGNTNTSNVVYKVPDGKMLYIFSAFVINKINASSGTGFGGISFSVQSTTATGNLYSDNAIDFSQYSFITPITWNDFFGNCLWICGLFSRCNSSFLIN